MQWCWREEDTYSADDLVEGQQAICNVGEFKGSQPSVLVLLEFVIDDHARADDHVRGSEASKADQGLLTDAEPWRVADAQKDGLEHVSRLLDGEKRSIRDHPSCSSEGAQ